MIFQALDYKEKNFLDLNDNDNLSTGPMYLKGDAWLKHFRHCMCILLKPLQITPQLENTQ